MTPVGILVQNQIERVHRKYSYPKDDFTVGAILLNHDKLKVMEIRVNAKEHELSIYCESDQRHLIDKMIEDFKISTFGNLGD